MIDQGAERDELNLATGAMIDSLLMDGAVEMLIESHQTRKASMTKTTFEASSIFLPSSAGGSRGFVRFAGRILNQAVRKDVIAVHLAAVIVDFLTINAGGTPARFQV